MSQIKVQESRLFSKHCADAGWLKALRNSSVSTADANSRKAEYNKLFSKYQMMKEAYTRLYSGVSERPLLSNQYFNATVASFVRSFAGYFTIERDMAEPTALLWYDDVLNVVNEQEVLPNIGKENLEGIDNVIKYENQTIEAAGDNLSTGQILVPHSVNINLVSADGALKAMVIDDGQGNLMAASGILSEGTVDYKSGTVKFTVSSANFVGGTYTMVASADVPGSPAYGVYANNQQNRFKLGMKNILVTSVADELIGESNLVAMAQAQKSLGQDPMEVMGAKLVELYTKLLNRRIADEVMAVNSGNAYEIDVRGWMDSYYDFNSRLNAFSSEMVNIDTELAEQSTKGVEATAYLVGKKAGNWFRQLRATGEFTEEKGSTYVNDLLGFYHEIPVVRHLNVGTNDIYAVHKTAGGELAPVMLGQYLPLTFSPNVGSYSNPTQLANAVFYQLGLRKITDALVVKSTIIEK